MIKKVYIKNINSINEATINFEKGRYQFLNENIMNDKLVNPVAFYGKNGSGKTSFIEALTQMVAILWKEPGNYNMFIPNLFNKSKKSEMKIWFDLNEIEYIYTVQTDIYRGIEKEKLEANDKEVFTKKDIITYEYQNDIKFLDASNYSVLRRIASDLSDKIVVDAYNYLSNIAYIGASKHMYSSKILNQKSIDDLMVEKSQEVKNILETYNDFPLYNYVSHYGVDGKKNYYFILESSDKTKTMHKSYMSSGMYNQSVLLSILSSLPEKSTMLIDEIEDALHPLTILDFIQVVRDKNIQLIFSSHNTHILQSLRPDQIIFANWNEGYSGYKKLSDIYPNIREINNIEKMYFAHMFDDKIKLNE